MYKEAFVPQKAVVDLPSVEITTPALGLALFDLIESK